MEKEKIIEEMERDSYAIKMQGESELSKVFNEFLEGNTYVKQKHGEWKVRGLPRGLKRLCEITHQITCSNCGFDIEMLQGKRYRYCPNCGAKMKGAERYDL